MLERDQPYPGFSSLVVQSVTRPKRVAFLYDQAKATLEEIDIAILSATECWGGAYWPLVPFTEGGIASEWWSLLDAIDPDVVCALHSLSDSLKDQIARRCAPLRIHQSATNLELRRGRSLVSHHDLRALSTAQTPAAIYAEQRLLPMYFRFLVLEDKGGDSPNRAFALRNFGALAKDVRFSRSFDDLAHQWLDASEKTPIQLFGDFAMGGPVTPRDMARFKAERPFLPEWSTEARSFWLVVGDSPLDVALAWNSMVSQEGHLGRSCLWLSKAHAEDTELLAEVVRWIGRSFYSGQGGADALVLSYSEPIETLEAVARSLKSAARLSCRALTSDQSLFGKVRRPFRPPSELTRIQQVPMRGDTGLMEFVRPAFVSGGTQEPGWMVDLEVEHPRDPSISSPTLPVWKVPRRSGIASCFGGSQRSVRIAWDRTPSFEVLGSDSDVRFRVPAARDVFEWCLVPTVVTDNGVLTAKLPHPFTLQTSDAGLQLRGVLRVFGGLFQAGHCFENPFWRDLLTEMAGRPEDVRARQTKAVLDVLLTAAEQSGGQIAAAEAAGLAERVAEKAWRSEPSTRRVELNNLSSKFGAFVAKWGKDHPRLSSFRPGEKFDDWAANDLANLIENGVLHQGTRLRCLECFTEYWLHVDDLRRITQCPGCLSHVQLPPNPRWTAQANELVSGAIRQRGVLPVVHALYELQRQTHAKTFTFIASQDVLTYPEGKKLTDLDLLVLVDGGLLIGEVKSNARGFDPEAVEALTQIAKVMLPETVLFAAESDGKDWPADIAQRLEGASEELRPLGITVLRELLEWM